jgi:hypothetical protein
MVIARHAPATPLTLIVLVGLAAVVAACGAVSADDDDDGTGGSKKDASVFDPSTYEGGVDQTPGNPSCHEQNFVPQKVGDPDVMILMDMSSSMADGTPTKYSQTSSAVASAVTSGAADIEWGLIFFPSDGDCAVAAAPDVAVAAGNQSQISSTLTSTSPVGNTPAYKAVALAVNYYDTLNDGRGHYILIATDGQPNCEGNSGGSLAACQTDADCPSNEYCQMIPLLPNGRCMANPSSSLAVTAIQLALQNGVKTYVVGIDIDSGSADMLNRMADAGGTARAGDPRYYPVSDQASLEQALANITTQIISCTFALDQAPPADSSWIGVSVGGHTVPHDPTHANGWDVDGVSKTLTFYGAACTELQSNPAAVSVTFACSPID